jgi:hypothetical protein
LAHVGILRGALWRLFPKALDLQQASTSHKRSGAIHSGDDRSVIELSCRGDGAPNAAVMARPIILSERYERLTRRAKRLCGA